MNSREWQNFIKNTKELGIEVNPQQLIKFQNYYNRLIEWNKKINLISRKDTTRIVSYHFIDSLTALNLIPKKISVADYGSGGGLPGIPIKILRADIVLYLIESIQKKVSFLRQVVEELALKDTFILSRRAEDLIGVLKFDIILIRLVGRLKNLVPIISQLITPTGMAIFYKSQGLEQELDESKKILVKFGLRVKEIKEISLSKIGIKRRLLILVRDY